MTNTPFRKILHYFVALVFLLMMGLYYFFNYGHTVRRDQNLKLKGLKDKVEVYTDKFGVPHIKAQNNHDMMMTLGYITAADRLWQMDLLRRIGAGRLSEIFGPELLDIDIFLRKMGMRRHMAEVWPKFEAQAPAEMLMQIEAYFKGVNTYIKKGPRPLEMKLLNYFPEEFNIIDALGIAGYMSLSFAESLFIDTLYTDLLDELPKKEVDLIFPRALLDNNSQVLTEKIPLQSKHSLPLKTITQRQPLQPSKEFYQNISTVLYHLKDTFNMFQGSNAWVLAPHRSMSGYAILANDPHIAYAAPSLFYEAHIKSPEYENYGHYIPSIPFPGLAHNGHRAWGITMSYADDLDFYQETFHPTEKKVLFKNKYVNYREVREEIKVKGQKEPHVETVIITPHGPILEGTKYVPQGQSLSVKWQFLNETNNPAQTFYLLSQSQELKDLAPALSHAAAPGFNIIFADAKGNIGWHTMGKIPVLNHPGNGRTVLDGASGKDEHVRYLDIMENPHLYNPESGVIVSANYKPVVQGPIPWVGMWQAKDRFFRIETLLAQKEKWDLENLKMVQTDEYVPFYKSFIDDYLSDVEPKNELEKIVLEKMKQWDGDSSKTSPSSSVYSVVYHILIKNILQDELGEERLSTYLGGSDGHSFLYYILKQKNSILWDDISTKEKQETAKDIINLTYTEAVEFLKTQLGANPEAWQWGKLNSLEIKHVMGQKGFPLNKIFNLGPKSVGGGANQVNAMGSLKRNLQFDVHYGPSTRRLIDFKDPTKSYGLLPTGNSGHRSSKNYSDQMTFLINNTYRTQNMSFENLEGPVKKMILSPGN